MHISMLFHLIAALRTSPLTILALARFLLVANALNHRRLSETSRVRVSARETNEGRQMALT